MKKLIEEMSIKHEHFNAKLNELENQLKALDKLSSKAYWKIDFHSEFKTAFANANSKGLSS